MSLEPDEVLQIARLARMAVSKEQAADYASDLSRILELVEQMDQVDTDTVEPLAHPLELAQRLRPDAVTETDARETFQAGAPAIGEGLYLVPKVIE